MLWEEMTAPEFAKGVKEADGVCILVVGVLEKHGEHLPLATDEMTGRHIAVEAAKREPAIVFPHYYFGQILEARHQPGGVAISGELMLRMLGEVCGEISRNGLKKIILLNPHGGNTHFLNYFCQLALDKEADYSLYLPTGGWSRKAEARIKKLFSDPYDGHAGESETSCILAIHPHLVRIKADIPSRGLPKKGLSHLPGVSNGFSWYGMYPHHYSGIGKLGARSKGAIFLRAMVDYMAEVIRAVKKDKVAPRLAREFFRKSRRPFAST